MSEPELAPEEPQEPQEPQPTASPSAPPTIRRITWRQHYAWLDSNMEPGWHTSVVVKTNGGKTYLIRHGLLPLWAGYRVLIFDVKGDDEGLAGLGQEVDAFPDREREPNPGGDRIYRLVVPPWEFDSRRRDTDGLRRARSVAGGALDEAYRQGDWLIVLDESQPFMDNQNAYGLGLQGLVRNIWQRGRTRRVTLIAATQEPVWMPAAFYSQPTLLYVGAEVDPTNEHLRAMGADRRLIVGAVAQLREHEFLAISRAPRGIWVVKVGR